MSPGTDLSTGEIDRLRRRLDRERRVRAEAEALAEKGTRLLYERQLEMSLLHEIADAANAAQSVERAVRITLDLLCAYTTWPVGHVYLTAPQPPLTLLSAQLWHCDEPERFGAFLDATRNKSFLPGEGLPGRVLISKQAISIENVTVDPNFPRHAAAKAAGLLGAFAFPVLAGNEVVAVFEFFCQDATVIETTRVKLAQQVGMHLGRVFERQRAEQALRESEIRFRQVVENMGEALWMQDATDGRVLYVSPRYAQIWGLPPTSLIESPSAWREVIHPDDRGRIPGLPAAGTEETYRLRRPDGTVCWVRHRTHAVFGAGKVQRLISVAEDVTERQKLEEQFLRAQRVDAIGTLASGIAHDLNNILTPVLVAAELIKAPLPDDRRLEMASLIENGAKRGAGIVKQLLMFSRGVEGTRSLVAVPALMREVGNLVRETFPRNLTLTEETGPSIPSVLADSTQIHQVLVNLCVNARDAMPEGGRLTLATHAVELEAGDLHLHAEARTETYAVITVADTGTGMSLAVQQKLFNPFFTTKGIGKGTGLGLSTVAGIVRGHGGFVTVTSEVGRGTTFKVYLPAPAAAQAPEADLPVEAPLLGNRELVLVTDDEPAIRESTRMLFEKHRYRVLLAKNGQDALMHYFSRQEEIKLVVTDMMMPVMDGVSLVQALRRLAPKMKILGVSGIVDDARRAELAALGVASFLAKPYSPHDLLKAVRDELARP